MSICVLSRKEQHTGTRTFWFKRFSLITLVTFDEAYSCLHMLSISIHLLKRCIRLKAFRITALSFELHTLPLPETHVEAELLQMDRAVQRSVSVHRLRQPGYRLHVALVI